MDILSWRKFFSNIVIGAKKVIAPSRDILERVRVYIPDAKYVYLMHPESYISFLQAKATFASSELKILVLGKLSLAKGLKLLEACAIDAKERQLPLYFRVIGTGEKEVKKEPEVPLSFYGAYNDINCLHLLNMKEQILYFFRHCGQNPTLIH